MFATALLRPGFTSGDWSMQPCGFGWWSAEVASTLSSVGYRVDLLRPLFVVVVISTSLTLGACGQAVSTTTTNNDDRLQYPAIAGRNYFKFLDSIYDNHTRHSVARRWGQDRLRGALGRANGWSLHCRPGRC